MNKYKCEYHSSQRLTVNRKWNAKQEQNLITWILVCVCVCVRLIRHFIFITSIIFYKTKNEEVKSGKSSHQKIEYEKIENLSSTFQRMRRSMGWKECEWFPRNTTQKITTKKKQLKFHCYWFATKKQIRWKITIDFQLDKRDTYACILTK